MRSVYIILVNTDHNRRITRLPKAQITRRDAGRKGERGRKGNQYQKNPFSGKQLRLHSGLNQLHGPIGVMLQGQSKHYLQLYYFVSNYPPPLAVPNLQQQKIINLLEVGLQPLKLQQDHQQGLIALQHRLVVLIIILVMC